MFEVSKICFILLVQYFTLNICLPSRQLNEMQTSDKVIQRKRQDTIEMCRLFDAETNSLASGSVKRQKRVKRDATLEDIADQDDVRVEKIVEKMYDEINEKLPEKVTYKRRFNVMTRPTPSIKNRRVDFHPHMLTVNLDNDTISSAEKEDIEEGPGWYKTGPYRNWAKQWVDGIVYYIVDPKTYDFHLEKNITSALEYIQKSTCIRFQRFNFIDDKISSVNVLWMYITNPTGIHQCVHSNEQKKAHGVQIVVLGYDCMSQGQIMHEILHVLGFAHEHTRPDRDLHVSIFWDNIKDGYKKYFQMRKEDLLLHLPYDYASVLHYPPRSFSRNGKLTVMPKVDSRLGQREGLSEGDVAKVSAVYGGQCYKRNRRHLMKTCPVVRTHAELVHRKPTEPTPEEIENYYKDRIYPLGLVNYAIRDKMEFTEEEREKIQGAMEHIQNETCIRFVEQASLDKEPKNEDIPTGVHPLKDDSNSSLGFTSLRRHTRHILIYKYGTKGRCISIYELPLTKGFEMDNCLNSPFSLLHFLGHALGLNDEERRHDRDSYIKLEGDAKKIIPKTLPPAASAGFPYDYQSVVSFWGFFKGSLSAGNQGSILPIWDDGWLKAPITALSETNIKKINKIYEKECRRREIQESY